MSSPAKKLDLRDKLHHEPRIAPRIRVRWHVEAFIDGQRIQRGFIKEISMSGTGIYLHKDVQTGNSFRLRIYMPPFTSTSVPYTIDVNAKVKYSVLDSHESLFRAGIFFAQFNLPSDKEYLQKHIETLASLYGIKNSL